LYYYLSDKIINSKECENLIVNSASIMGRSIMAAGVKHNLNVFHIRHSVVTGYTPETPFGAIEFVEGPLATKHLDQVSYVEDKSNFIESGFPYLTELVEEERERYTVEEPIRVLLATQPYSDTVRLTFIREVLTQVAESDHKFNITIKTHPGEETEFYKKHFQDNNVQVASGDLREYFKDADLVITINSNAGLEALLAGIPCVTLNFWKPFIREMPYSRYLPVPSLESEKDVTQFFSKLGVNALIEIQCSQQSEIPTNILLDGDAAERIANFIEFQMKD